MLTHLQPFNRCWHCYAFIFLALLVPLSGAYASVNSTELTLFIPYDDHAAEPLKKAIIVQGTVTDQASNGGLPGVNVLVKGTNRGTVTDVDGKYSINTNTPNDTLIFSSIGYVTQEVPVRSRSQLNVTMAEDLQSLDEVVVVGFGTQEKVNLTGAVGVADGEVLEKRPIANTGEGLQGVIPNLNIAPRNGDPAQPITFNVRGYESINGGQPLVLVDNIPMDLNRINPNDIESVSVLKDAAAAAIYGARAAFGVILVTTKRGRDGKVRVNLDTQWSLARPIFNMDPVTDPHEFVLARNRANIRTNGVPTYDDNMVEGTRAWSENPATAPAWAVVDGTLRFYGNNNYQEDIMTDFAPTQQHNLSISGGTDSISYYASFGFLNKDGYLRYNNENFKRYNILMRGEFKVKKWLTLEESIIFNSQNNDEPYFYNWDVNINSLARVNPIQPIQFPDLPHYITPGDREQYEQYIGMYFGGTNFFPYLLDGGRSQFSNTDVWLTQGLKLTPIKGLKIQGNFSYNIFNMNRQDSKSKVEIVSTDLTEENPVSFGFSGDDWIFEENRNNIGYVLNAFAEYEYKELNNHYFKAMVGYNQEWNRYKRIAGQARSLITPLITDLNATTGVQQTFGNSAHIGLRGAFFRFNYNFKERYLIETNGRYDGTSRFPTDDRFGFFPSVSLGWRISNENFMFGTSNWLDNLKVRASYGELGNQNLGNDFYPYIATMRTGQSPYMMAEGLIPAVYAPGLVSPTLTWETVVSRNIGLDVTMFGGRLDASFDAYTRDTRDMLMNVELPDVLGTSAPRTNAADLRTTGWEMALTWRNKTQGGFSYDLTLALADWTAEITRYDNPSGALSEFYVGQQLGEIWGYETVGIFQSEEEVLNSPDQSILGANWRPGDIRYADLNGDGIISPGSNTLDDPGDRTIIGNETPRMSYGFTSSLAYKGFRLTTFFQGIGRRDYWPSDGNWTWFFPFNAGHVEKYYITDTWTEENRDAYFPAAHISTNDKKNLQRQSRFIQNAGYVRLKNITLSYDLPEAFVQRLGISGGQLYFTGMNLWEFSPIRAPLDPETIYAGAIEYPMQRIFGLGANITF